MRKITVNVETPTGTSPVEFADAGIILSLDGHLVVNEDMEGAMHEFQPGTWSGLQVTEEPGL